MAERIVSPGVFTQENDLSFLPVGIGEIGAVLIGGTETGPAFMPVQVRSMNEFELKFGSSTKGTYLPFTVKEYIKNAGVVTIVRTLGLDGFESTDQVFLIASGSSTGASGSTIDATADKFILGVIHASTIGDTSDKDGTLSETSVIMSTVTPGAKAGGLFNIDTTGGIDGVLATNIEFQIGTSDSNEFRFIGSSTPAPADGGGTFGPFYFVTGSTATATATALAAEINAHATNVTAIAQNEAVAVTASVSGIAGNSIRVQTGSGATFATAVTLTGGTADTALGTSGDGALTGNGVFTMTKFMGNSNHLASTSNTSSFDKTNSNYLPNLLGTDSGKYLPSAAHSDGNSPSYVYSIFNSQSYGASNTNTGGGYAFTKLSASLASIDFNSTAATVTGTNSQTSGKSYNSAATPWVLSQENSSGNTFPLFKIHTLSHGTDSNRKYKVSVTSIKKAGSVSGQDYGNFSVTVRKIDDTDNKVVALETYSNCNLDPSSPNYIARLIGDRDRSYDANGKLITTGDYPNLSKYIRVEAHENVKNAVYSDQLVPFGHEKYISPFAITVTNEDGATSVTATYPEAALVTSRSLATDTVTYFGFNFNEDVLNNGMYNYLAPISDNAAVGKNKTFQLSNCSNGSGNITLDSPLNNKRFTLGFQGGFDGVNPAKQVTIGKDLASGNSFGFSFASTSDEGYRVYKKDLDTVSNPDEIDINLIVTPGILTQNASNIVTKVMDVCEARGDAFYIVDGVNSLNGDSVSAAVAQAANYDTNYASMYYPWVRIFDASVNKFLFVPPSVVVPGVMSFNDKVAFPWFAPAGLNRGSLTTVSEPYSRLTHAERDELYEGKVNPIAVFPQVGVCVWGQKTLQTKPSALDRINVRRLLIKLKKFIASSTRYLVFENNTTATRNRFLNIVNPYLETVQQQQGLYAFKVVMDETNNTPDVIDRNQMKGEIFLQPAKAAEFIIVDFNILRTGASFEE